MQHLDSTTHHSLDTVNLINKTTSNFAAAASAALAIGAAGVLATAPAANAYGSMSWGEETKTTRTPKAPPVSCPAGRRYAHIKIGGLLFKKDSFQGLRHSERDRLLGASKAADMNRRWQNFAQGPANEPRLTAIRCRTLHLPTPPATPVSTTSVVHQAPATPTESCDQDNPHRTTQVFTGSSESPDQQRQTLPSSTALGCVFSV